MIELVKENGLGAVALFVIANGLAGVVVVVENGEDVAGLLNRLFVCC